MNDRRKIQFLKSIQDEKDEDVLSSFLYLAKSKILQRMYPFKDVDVDSTPIPDKYEDVQLEIAQYLLNKRGAEGEVQHTENGTTRTYENADVPFSILRQVIPYVGVLGGKSNETDETEYEDY